MKHSARSQPQNGPKISVSPWRWVPPLYFAEGLPYVLVMTVSVIMYKRLGISNTEIALYTSWLYLPWVIKPLWSPVVDNLKTKRFWIILMQVIIGAALGGVALTIPTAGFFKYSLAFFWLLAFSSATHDIAIDGFYMLGLSKHRQALFVGIRSTFYRFAMIAGQGLLIILAGYLESITGLPTVTTQVYATPGIEIRENANLEPESMQAPPGEHQVILLASPSTLNIATALLSRDKADSIINYAKESNRKNGFYRSEAEQLSVKSTKESSWWDRLVVSNLENVLRKYFGPEETSESQENLVGNVGLLYFRLSKRPENVDRVVVNFGRESGDSSLKLLEGDHFVFTQNNWNKPFIAVIQLDPKLTTQSEAIFRARAGNIPLSWSFTFLGVAGLFLLFFLYHKRTLPYPASDAAGSSASGKSILAEFINTFALFFKKKNVGLIVAFLMLYRFAEAQLVKLAAPFLLDAREIGGLALTTGEFGFVYGTVGIIFLVLGGLLGGFLASKNGLKYWLWWMLLAINLPDAVYVYLSYTQPDNYWIINLMVALEQFGYGFGFTAFMLYMIYVSEGEHKTAHFAICTGFMALGMMIPGMFSGWLQEIIGYPHFFLWIMISTIPAFIVTRLIHIDPEFGKNN